MVGLKCSEHTHEYTVWQAGGVSHYARSTKMWIWIYEFFYSFFKLNWDLSTVSESNIWAVTGHFHTLLWGVVSDWLCQMNTCGTLTFPECGQLYQQFPSPSEWSLLASTKACPARGDDRSQGCLEINWLRGAWEYLKEKFSVGPARQAKSWILAWKAGFSFFTFLHLCTGPQGQGLIEN